MDKTTKFLLGLIAVGLIAINIQLYDGTNSVIKPAYAVDDGCGSWEVQPCYVRTSHHFPLRVFCTNCD